jgi:hypothetical protein
MLAIVFKLSHFADIIAAHRLAIIIIVRVAVDIAAAVVVLAFFYFIMQAVSVRVLGVFAGIDCAGIFIIAVADRAALRSLASSSVAFSRRLAGAVFETCVTVLVSVARAVVASRSHRAERRFHRRLRHKLRSRRLWICLHNLYKVLPVRVALPRVALHDRIASSHAFFEVGYLACGLDSDLDII